MIIYMFGFQCGMTILLSTPLRFRPLPACIPLCLCTSLVCSRLGILEPKDFHRLLEKK